MLRTFAREIVADSTISTPDFDVLPPTAARIARARWQEWIENAARDAVVRIVEPAGALAREAAPGDTSHAISAVVRRLRAASPYDYIPEIVEQYAERKGMVEITGAELTSLLGRIERRMSEGLDADEWISLAEPLFQFGRARPAGAVPAEIVRRFLVVRGAEPLANLLPDQGPLTAQDVRRILGGAVEGGATNAPGRTSAAERVENPPPPEPSGDGVPVTSPSLGKVAEPVRETPSGDGVPGPGPMGDTAAIGPDMPLWKRFLGDDKHEQDPTEQEEHIPLWKRFFGTAEPEEDQALDSVKDDESPDDSLEAFFGASSTAEAEALEPEAPTLESLEEAILGEGAGEWRRLYVDSLFGGKEEEYERVLSLLLLAEDWPSASEVIAGEVFKKRKVDIYAVPAVAFTDAVEARFEDG